MAKSPAVPVNPSLLAWAREEAGLTVAEAAQALNVKEERVLAWEAGDARPTVNQARNAAGLYRRTLAWLLTPGEPPEAHRDRPPDFRGVQTLRISPQLNREIRRARDRRRAFMDLQPDPPGALPEIAGVLEAPEAAAAEFAKRMGIGSDAQVAFPNATEALRAWVQVLERHGVIVFQMSRIDPKECRGVSLYDDVYPVILLNGADEPEGRLFSLLHEVAHLLGHSSGVCQVWRGTAVERRCNLFAGAALMPRAPFLRAVVQERPPVDQLQRLATHFNVSQSAVAIRLRDLGRISQEELDEQLGIAQRLAEQRRERDRERSKASGGGPPHYRTQLRNLGPTYVGLVLDALHSRAISPVDATYFLESKLSTIDQMEQELLRRGASA